MTEKFCRTCKFWEPDAERAPECRRYSPKPSFNSGRGIFPITGPAHWCGDWRTKEEAKAES